MSHLTKQRYIIRLRLNGRDIQTRVLDDTPLQVGRTQDNDFVIDNLAVSRRHAEILVGPNGPVIRDLSSTNGLIVDGHTVAEAVLHGGSTVQIGKHSLHIEAEPGRGSTSSASTHLYEPTIRVAPDHRLDNPAHLVEERDDAKGNVYPIDTTIFVMGKSDASDVRLEGMLIADYHVEIRVEGDVHRLVHLAGRRKVKVNGDAVAECTLRDGDGIEIAGRVFRFRCPS
jgi:pSer/pThr/pTyr-binding forkhead associated (FHA) protein